MSTYQELKAKLTNIFWIGGPPDAGKTTIATELFKRHGWQLYRFDKEAPEIWDSHFRHMKYSASYRLLWLSLDRRWVERPPETMRDDIFSLAHEYFPVMAKKLAELPRDVIVVAEGCEFLPELVSQVISSPRQAIWLWPTESFQYNSFLERGKPDVTHKCSDPEKAAQNHFERNALLGQHIKSQALQKDLPLLEIDGSLSIPEVTQIVEDHFLAALPAT